MAQNLLLAHSLPWTMEHVRGLTLVDLLAIHLHLVLLVRNGRSSLVWILLLLNLLVVCQKLKLCLLLICVEELRKCNMYLRLHALLVIIRVFEVMVVQCILTQSLSVHYFIQIKITDVLIHVASLH